MLALDKWTALSKLRNRRSDIENALQVRSQILKFLLSSQDTRDVRVIRRVLLHEKDIADQEKLKKIYSMLSDEIHDDRLDGQIKIKVREYIAMDKYLRRTVDIDKSNTVGLALNSGLVGSLLQNILSATDRSAINQSTIVGMLVGKKMRQDTRSYVVLIVGVALHLALSLFGAIDVNSWLIAFLVFMMGALSINQKVLEYRIKYGLYGGTAYEAREILKFIDEHTEKGGFGDGDRKRKIFQEAIEDAPKELLVYGGAYR